MSNDSKATAIANEIIFYLCNEIRAQAFPPRVNPDKLREITREEIESRQSSSPEVESPESNNQSPVFQRPKSILAIDTSSSCIGDYVK